VNLFYVCRSKAEMAHLPKLLGQQPRNLLLGLGHPLQGRTAQVEIFGLKFVHLRELEAAGIQLGQKGVLGPKSRPTDERLIEVLAGGHRRSSNGSAGFFFPLGGGRDAGFGAGTLAGLSSGGD
jgi:hypothetical protein